MSEQLVLELPFHTPEDQPQVISAEQIADQAHTDQLEAAFKDASQDVRVTSVPGTFTEFTPPKAEDMLIKGSVTSRGQHLYRENSGRFMSKQRVMEISSNVKTRPAAEVTPAVDSLLSVDPNELVWADDSQATPDSITYDPIADWAKAEHNSDKQAAQKAQDAVQAWIIDAQARGIIAEDEVSGLIDRAYLHKEAAKADYAQSLQRIAGDLSVLETQKAAETVNTMSLVKTWVAAEKTNDVAAAEAAQAGILASLDAEGLDKAGKAVFMSGLLGFKKELQGVSGTMDAPVAASRVTNEWVAALGLSENPAQPAATEKADLTLSPEDLALLRAASIQSTESISEQTADDLSLSAEDLASLHEYKEPTANNTSLIARARGRALLGLVGVQNRIASAREGYKENDSRWLKAGAYVAGVAVLVGGGILIGRGIMHARGDRAVDAHQAIGGRPTGTTVNTIPVPNTANAPQPAAIQVPATVGPRNINVPTSVNTVPAPSPNVPSTVSQAIIPTPNTVATAHAVAQQAPVPSNNVFSITEAWKPNANSPTAWSWAESQGIPRHNIPAFLNEVMGPDWAEEAQGMNIGDSISATAEQIARFKVAA